ncbi:hypothetical protein NV226_02335 [Mycoplasma iguanae]|uniref:Glucosamine-6-phosphate deaminase n=1 Tax=Mycoplasma iguanae TaxID=292461 RepID=A0ABY5R989_9MOLU|nr:hypothetical protein [Mycoplasma iguanae]UVD81545.1 hypothetical protein NV226_02335 [Mycoplasma iguanae]
MKIKLFLSKEKAYIYLVQEIIDLVNNNSKVNLALELNKDLLKTYSTLKRLSVEQNISYTNVSFFNTSEIIKTAAKKNEYHSFFLYEKILKELFDINPEKIYTPIKYQIYDEIIEKKGGLDLLVLTIGKEGEIIFNKAPASRIGKTDKVVIEDNQTLARIGLDTILQAKKIIVQLFGSEKHITFNKLKNIKKFDPEFPASILKKHQNVEIVVDEEAF